ncbi:MAG: glycoside hydrolase family 127 protein [Verrucomicrobiae bacterium]|nr:glycoside hydrolase family 127 protein [Verrucomicrobiae bacterium]
MKTKRLSLLPLLHAFWGGLFLCVIVSMQTDAANLRVVDTTASPYAALKSVDLDSVRWTKGFWADRYQQTDEFSLRRLWELAADPEAGHVLDNMRIVAGLQEGEFAGTNWQDAWLYKWIEAAACIYKETGDPWIEARMDEGIALIAKAQEADGYISTQITARGKPRFQDPREHEVYCMGHLLTAACIHQRMTGKDTLFNVALKTADFLCETLGVSVSPAYAHNPSAVMGLVEMYRVTGQEKYLDCSKRIVDQRGAHPKRGGLFYREPGIEGTDLIQDRTPLRQAKEVVGHNVFFTYLYAGAADVYLETGDKTLLAPLERLWADLVQRKISINGGVSPMGRGLSIGNDPVIEAVGPAYYLPNEDSYNETCGQVGNFMWNYRMLCITQDARYADMMERELYNGFLGGIGLEGESWFYRNALRRYDVHHTESGHNDMAQRGLPGPNRICCPTNLLRTLAELQAYVYSISDEGLWVHHYAGNVFNGSLADGSDVRLIQDTQYPWDGKVVMSMEAVSSSKPFTMHLRIPAWATGAQTFVNGKTANEPVQPGSYLKIRRSWKPGDTIQLELPMAPRLMQAHPKAEQLRNQVAVMRGPVLYCLESVDLPDNLNLDNVFLPGDLALKPVRDAIQSVEMVCLTGKVFYRPDENWGTDLYRPIKPSPLKPINIRMIPYYAWNNRGPAAMSVWLPVVYRD